MKKKMKKMKLHQGMMKKIAKTTRDTNKMMKKKMKDEKKEDD